MAYTYTRASTTFTAGESAPSAVEVSEGAQIVNQYDNIALQEFTIDSTDRESSMELDMTVEPPTLRLNNVIASALFGYVNAEGAFVQSTSTPNAMEQRVTGDYSGPGSELHIR